MLTKDAKERASADNWNSTYPVGQTVKIICSDNKIFRTTTKTKAFIGTEGTAVIALSGIPRSVRLLAVMPYVE